MNDDTNWLCLSRITCSGCQRIWHRVDRSPMADDWRFYCDQCGNSVEVSYYDPRVLQEMSSVDRSYLDHHRAIEADLRSCECGGHYRHDSPRRCTDCLVVLVADEAGVDLYPFIFDFEALDRDPTPQEQAQYDKFEKAHIRNEDIWKTE